MTRLVSTEMAQSIIKHNTKRRNTVRAIIFFTTCLFALSHSANAEKTYIYKESDGTVWHSNVAPAAQDTGRYKLLQVKGRSPAKSSCSGMTPDKMDKRAARYLGFIEKYATEFRVDSKLIKAVIRNESCFDKSAVSKAGAQGLMQLMPATAKSLGVTDSFDVQQNVRAGTQYLAQLIKDYNHNLALALAAYNAGPGAVSKFKGVPPYRETQTYIERVMKSYKGYLREYIDTQ